MKELVKEKYNGYINDMRKAVGNREERWNILQQCLGMLQFAYDLELLHIFDVSNMYDNLFKERACDTVEAIKKFEQEEANMLPFEEVPEEEQETFEIEDLPFPEVMEPEEPEEDEPGDSELKEIRSQTFEDIKKKLEDGDIFTMNYPFDKAILSRVYKEIPGCCVVPGKEILYLVDEEDIEYLQEHLEDELDRAESEAFDFRLALEHCWPHVRRYDDKLCAEGRRFSVHNGVLVKGNPEAYAAFQESEEVYAAFMERQVQ